MAEPARWPIPDEAVVAALTATVGYAEPADVPPMQDALAAAAPHIVAATLRQAADRYEVELEAAVTMALGAASFAGQLTIGQSWDGTRLVADAAAVAIRLRAWADEVQP